MLTLDGNTKTLFLLIKRFCKYLKYIWKEFAEYGKGLGIT